MDPPRGPSRVLSKDFASRDPLRDLGGFYGGLGFRA